jgi:anaerobic ribonucleoside-triphosphate reductase activating protein
MNYATIKKHDISNGLGVRVSLFVSGCRNRCKNCFQPQTWNFEYGQPFTEKTEERILRMLAPSYITGLTLLGGEPFERENQAVLLPFVRRVREAYPTKTVWAFTGFTFEELLQREDARPLLEQLDLLVDGRFVESEKNIALRFRGSANQRVLDVPASLAAGTAVWCEKYR